MVGVSTARDILESALALPDEERAALVDALNDSLEHRRDELGPGWGEEIARRLAALERGESRLVPGHEVSARVRKTLREI